MPTNDTNINNRSLCLVTFKISNEFLGNETISELFENRDYCDQFIRSLIYFIHNKKLKLFGFVILSNQIHLIINCECCEQDSVILDMKKYSAKETLSLMGKTLNAMDQVDTKKHKDLRKAFNRFLNEDESVLWQKKHNPILLNIEWDQKLSPISSDVLESHLNDEDRNYLHVGANAFTKLMLDAMKF